MSKKKRRILRAFLLCSCFLLCGFLCRMEAHAAPSRSLYWERIDVQIDIQKDGSLAVMENLRYVFDGPWRGGYRVLSRRGLDSLLGFEVWEGDRPYQAGGLGKYQYLVSRVRGGWEVKWRCRNDDEPPFAQTRKDFSLRYRVRGALNHHRDLDELYWKAIFEDRDGIVKKARVLVRLPERVEGGRLRGDLFSGARASRFFRLDDQTVAFEGEEIPPRALFEVLVQFPAGLVERHFYWGRFLRERISPILPLFLPTMTFFLLFLLFWHKGRDFRSEQVASYLREPPSDLAPAVAGTLIDERAEMKEILATLVDLARRGYLELTEKKSGQWLFSKADLEIALKKEPDSTLLPFEQELLRGLFPAARAGSMISLPDLKDSFYRHLPGLREQIYQMALSRGFFESDPRKVVRKYIAAGILLLVPGLALLALDQPALAFISFWCILFAGIPAFILFKSAKEGKWGAVLFLSLFVWVGCGVAIAVIPSMVREYGLDWTGRAGLGLLLCVPLFFAFAPAMPRRTLKGSAEKAKWMAFYRYLKELGEFRDQATGADLYERYLPYAIAFGVEKEWTLRFADLGVAAPVWYHSHYYGDRDFGGTPHYRTGHGGAGSGKGFHVPTLQGMSDSLFSSLNSLSSALCSSPSSSGSGGGGGGGGGGGSGGGGGGGW
ncbi:MAG: DUF2207 domain-containing protein [candidate division NC10 bacterium]|nr:DUF2207 domain-containing protein [candidate division NC10 bacterium]